MTNKRSYTTRHLPRQPWPGETAPDFEPPINESLDLAHQIKAEVMASTGHSVRLAAELDQTRQRLATLEAAARAVCGPHVCIGLLFEAIEELGCVLSLSKGRVLGEVE